MPSAVARRAPVTSLPPSAVARHAPITTLPRSAVARHAPVTTLPRSAVVGYVAILLRNALAVGKQEFYAISCTPQESVAR